MTKLTPRPYQVRASEFLRERKRAMLYDKPGLGKTLAAAEAAEGRTLVLTRSYWVSGWFDFLSEQYSDTSVAEASGTQKERWWALGRNAQWTVGNLEMLRTFHLELMKWDTVIVDESHHLRGRNSVQSRAALDLAQAVERVYLLTGTPIYTEPDDLFAQLRLIDPKKFTSYYRFVDEYCNVDYSRFGARVRGGKGQAIKQLLSDYGLGRTYHDVRLELPAMNEIPIKVKLDSETKKWYEEARDYYRLQLETGETEIMVNAAQVLHALRRLTVRSKLEPAMDLAHQTNGAGIVYFCWYQDTADRLGKMLGVRPLTGQMDPTRRLEIASNPDTKRIVATVASLSEGVDLSRFRNVVFVEEPYEYGRLDQAMSRVRRWRETPSDEPVMVYYIHAERTVDEVVHKTVQRRKHYAVEEIMRSALLY